MKYKMIVLDLDGTLTNNKKEITPRTKEALMKAQVKGVKIVLASGRPTYGIMPLAEELELKKNGGFILAFNGGKIIDCSDCRTIFEQKLDEKPQLFHNYCFEIELGTSITYSYKITKGVARNQNATYLLKEIL